MVSIGVLEEVSSLSVSFSGNASASNRLSLLSVCVPVVIWRSIGIMIFSPETSYTSTLLVDWDCIAGLVSCAQFLLEWLPLCCTVRLAPWRLLLAQVALWFLGIVCRLAWPL